MRHRGGHRQRHGLGALGHRRGRLQCPLALVLAEDIAGQDGEGLVAGVGGGAVEQYLGHGIGSVVAQLDLVADLPDNGVGGFLDGLAHGGCHGEQ